MARSRIANKSKRASKPSAATTPPPPPAAAAAAVDPGPSSPRRSGRSVKTPARLTQTDVSTNTSPTTAATKPKSSRSTTATRKDSNSQGKVRKTRKASQKIRKRNRMEPIEAILGELMGPQDQMLYYVKWEGKDSNGEDWPKEWITEKKMGKPGLKDWKVSDKRDAMRSILSACVAQQSVLEDPQD